MIFISERARVLVWWKMYEQGCGLSFCVFCSERAWCLGLISGHFDSSSLSWHWSYDVDLIWASFMDPKRLLCTMWSHKDSNISVLRYNFLWCLALISFCFLDKFLCRLIRSYKSQSFTLFVSEITESSVTILKCLVEIFFKKDTEKRLGDSILPVVDSSLNDLSLEREVLTDWWV